MSGLTRDQLAAISQVHAVAMNLLSGNPVPMMAVAVLQDLPDLSDGLRSMCVAVWSVLSDLPVARQSWDDPEYAHAVSRLRDACIRSLAFRPCDGDRVDIHG